jgi:hypothetical protein
VKLLVDECCDPRLVAALREAGHDVRYVLETDPGASDEQAPEKARDTVSLRKGS